MLYFTSDLHFGHKNIIEYCKRPFHDVHTMNKVLTDNWNEVVTRDDTVYILGDFAFKSKGAVKEYFNRLEGNKVLIKGNHDNREVLSACKDLDIPVHDYLKIMVEDDEIGTQKLVLFHYPIMSWDERARGSWHLFGHVHNSLAKEGLSNNMLDVGVDSHNFIPISYQEVKTIITQQNLNIK